MTKKVEKNLKFWGHNCFSIISDKTLLITDPWFSNSGAFFGSWFQYPKNHHLKNKILELIELSDNAYIFITHEHQDHYDKEFLSCISKNTKILIPSYMDKSFRSDCESLGLEVFEIKDKEKYQLNKDFWISPYISHIGINHDSALLVVTEEFKFFNQNDCKIFDRLDEINESIDYYSVQFSGATWHPSNFILSDKRKKEISKQKVNNKLNSVLRGIVNLKPKYFLPAAGPAIFPYLDDELSFGIDNIFIHHNVLNSFLKRNNVNNILYLNPGDHLDDKKHLPINPPSNHDDLEEYKRNTINLWDKIDNIFDRELLEQSIINRLNEIKDIDIDKAPILIFNYTNTFNKDDHSNTDKIFIDLSNKNILSTFKYDKPYEEIISDKKYFSLMHSKERWQNIYLSLRAKVLREPDLFCNDINIFLFSDIENIRDNFVLTKNISNERIQVKNKNGEVFEINRFCPHNGADLCNAEINSDNYLVCPRHGWKFDLTNKGIDKLSKTTIDSKKIS
ncbi:MAG: Rieske 2Fe-2S domain-containing protein [Gammaproteobacteria bacterium]|nr:Rieske 2Fe-2S domain-containing protein [Gammaproteobacteria bacterium]